MTKQLKNTITVFAAVVALAALTPLGAQADKGHGKKKAKPTQAHHAAQPQQAPQPEAQKPEAETPEVEAQKPEVEHAAEPVEPAPVATGDEHGGGGGHDGSGHH